jgi:Family of unknown function (DUF5681)
MRQKRQVAPSSDTYTVGKGRPPLSTRWKPGQSGNPKGRLKGVKTMTTFHEVLSQKIEISENGKSRKVSVREAIVRRIISLALKGDFKAILQVFSKEPEIAAAIERGNIPQITADMTPREAMELYRRCIGGDHDRPIYPNRTRELTIDGPNQLWVADRTYLGIVDGVAYAALTSARVRLASDRSSGFVVFVRSIRLLSAFILCLPRRGGCSLGNGATGGFASSACAALASAAGRRSAFGMTRTGARAAWALLGSGAGSGGALAVELEGCCACGSKAGGGATSASGSRARGSDTSLSVVALGAGALGGAAFSLGSAAEDWRTGQADSEACVPGQSDTEGMRRQVWSFVPGRLRCSLTHGCARRPRSSWVG